MPQEARTLLFIHGPSAAEVQLQNLLSLVLHSYSLAAQCPAAIATASYSLAEVRAALEPAWQLEKNRSFGLKQLALLQLSLAMYPLAAHEECTQHLSLSELFFDQHFWHVFVPTRGPRCHASKFMQSLDIMSHLVSNRQVWYKYDLIWRVLFLFLPFLKMYKN